MEFLKRIDEYEGQMAETLQELIAIRSVQGEPAENAPFGEGVAKAYSYMMKRAEAEGFDTADEGGYGGHIEFGGYILDEEGNIAGTSEETMGILVHLDVVPEGEGWSYGPFSGTLDSGKIYGRGAVDDKGPAVAAFYAMKALKDSGFVPEKKVRLVLGLDEESGWKGMYRYLSKFGPPDFGFTPDAQYPVVNGEKGLLVFSLARKIGKSIGKGIELRSLKGGSAPNVVADFARAVVRSDKMKDYEKIKEKAESFREAMCSQQGQPAYGGRLVCKGVGKSLAIEAHGVAAHGAHPENGVNAITILMSFLGQVGIISEDASEFIEFYNSHIGFELDGASMGCGFSDGPSGKLVFNVGQAELDGEAFILTMNIRYPVTFSEAQVYEAMMPVINKYNMGIVKIKSRAPIYLPEDGPMIAELMDIYKKHTGDMDSRPIVIGGGTYARAAQNIVAFGSGFPGEEDLAHQKDEYITVESLVLNAKIFAEAIYRLANCVYNKKS